MSHFASVANFQKAVNLLFVTKEIIPIDNHIKKIKEIFFRMEKRIDKFEQQLIAELTKIKNEFSLSLPLKI